jgi:predicted CoA-substrate-specific enzyme activase
MNDKKSLFAGMDIGSMTTKCVIIDEDNDIVDSIIIPTDADPKTAGMTSMETVLTRKDLYRTDLARIVGTGYGRISIDLFDHTASELTCHAKGVRFLNPEILGIIDIGGQDSKAIKLNPDGSIYDFVLNDRCAAGTGRFLEIMARTLKTDLETFGDYYTTTQRPCTINSTCSVFAESEVISLLAQGEKKRDIAAGLHKSIAKRVGSMAARLKMRENIAFVGGVAKNQGMRKALEDYLGIHFIMLSKDPQITGAIGAAVMAKEQFLS